MWWAVYHGSCDGLDNLLETGYYHYVPYVDSRSGRFLLEFCMTITRLNDISFVFLKDS